MNSYQKRKQELEYYKKRCDSLMSLVSNHLSVCESIDLAFVSGMLAFGKPPIKATPPCKTKFTEKQMDYFKVDFCRNKEKYLRKKREPNET